MSLGSSISLCLSIYLLSAHSALAIDKGQGSEIVLKDRIKPSNVEKLYSGDCAGRKYHISLRPAAEARKNRIVSFGIDGVNLDNSELAALNKELSKYHSVFEAAIHQCLPNTEVANEGAEFRLALVVDPKKNGQLRALLFTLGADRKIRNIRLD